jgi:hypothetical protein
MTTLADKFKEFKIGTFLDITWTRGNGYLSKTFIYRGFNNDEVPILEIYEKFSESRNYFNTLSDGIEIKEIKRTPRTSKKT